MLRRRRVLTAAESREMLQRRMQLQRETMSAADIDALMRKTIDDCLDRIGAVSRDDLVRANVPEQAITMHFGKILREVRVARKQRGIHP